MVKQFTLFVFLFTAALHGFSQKLDSLFEIQRLADPQEKLYVQFDKNYYNPGETIWFKAYLFTGNEPSAVSTSFYAELMDEQGQVLSRSTAPVIFSGASGSFELDSAFRQATVFFRGYTISSLNSDTGFLFTRAIRVLTTKAPPTKAPATPPPPSISFLPEGGDMVVGLPSVGAFIASDYKALPLLFSGYISDNTGARVAELVPQHGGMGRVVLTPQEGKMYTAHWKTADGKTYETPLPAARPQGIVLRLTSAEAGKRFTLQRSAGAAQPLQVIAYMNQRLAFMANVDLTTKEIATGLFPTKELPSGILKITVLDAGQNPLAERICFVNNKDFEFDGDVFLSRKGLARRQVNHLEVMVSDTLPANLSLSVTDADLNESDRMADNIITRMLLTGELRGKIHNPYYYFFSTDDSASFHLDLVMLTHGWRRYNWKDLFAGKTVVPRWKENNRLSLRGQLAGLPPSSYAPDLQLVGILQTADSATTILNLPVDRKGGVFTDGLVFYDNARLYFNFNKKSLSFNKSTLMLDNGLYKGAKKVILDSLLGAGLPEISSTALTGNREANRLALSANRRLAERGMLASVTVTARVRTTTEKMEERYVSGLFSGAGARSFDLVNDPLAGSYIDIFQYLQGKVAGLQITGGGGNPTLSWRGGTPVFYLNEMQMDVSAIAATPVADIAYIKVFRPGESIVRSSGGGVIAIYTRKGGDMTERSDTKSLDAVTVAGYTPVKQFYSPDYATPNEREGLDDVRTTLYWNPTIYLGKGQRHLRFQFYNNDTTKRFRLVMEGINAEGKLVHIEKTISR